MARRASSKIRPLWLAVVAGALVLAVAGGVWLQGRGGDPYRTVAELDLKDYLENANSLRGNTYKIKGTVARSLGYSRAKGRLFSIEVAPTAGNGGSGYNNNGSGNGNADVLPILVPPELSYVNLQKGQRFTFRLEVGDGGVLKVLELRKG
ncbi:MAG: hypothetical protein JO117_01225 [Verrucomicrobia bacterium]|nr:hypothetical protein [Verrucomicrobiota bacterium]MBV9657361.1 hypothetical protein [Verrucomicrobiota bacterium]